MWSFKKNYDFKWLRSKLPPVQTVNYTPDALWLERHEWCLLFVYDELMLNRRQYSLIQSDSINLGKAFTQPGWSMYKKKLGEKSFPIALYKPEIGIQRRIKGEIHAIRPHLFWDVLDKKYFNTVEFNRERVQVLVPYRPTPEDGPTSDQEFIHKLRAHMYVGINGYWEDQIDGGYYYQPVKAFNPKVQWADGHTIGSYYCYTRLEDETNF